PRQTFRESTLHLGRAQTNRKLSAISFETGGAGTVDGKTVHQQYRLHWQWHHRRTRRRHKRAGLDRREVPYPQWLLRARKRDRWRRRRDGELVRVQELHPLR